MTELSKPVSFFWEPTNLCNLKCKHCYTYSSPNKELIVNIDDAKKLLKELSDYGIYSLGMGGGEPLKIPFLYEIIEYCKSISMNISISTNGTLIDDKVAKKLFDSGLKIVQVSLDGTKEAHEKIRGKGTFDKAINGIRSLVKNGIGVRIGYTVNAINYKDLMEMIDIAKELGVEVIAAFRYIPSSNYERDELNLSPEQLYEVTKILIEEEKNLIRQRNEKAEKFYINYEKLSFFSFLLEEKHVKEASCTATRGKFDLDPEGNVSVCSHLKKKVGNIKKMSYDDIWKSVKDFKKELDVIPEECIECKYAHSCKGGCKGISYSMYGDTKHKDPACFIKLLEEK